MSNVDPIQELSAAQTQGSGWSTPDFDTLFVGDPTTNKFIEFSDQDITAEILAAYSAAFDVVKAWGRWQANSTDYLYMVSLERPAPNPDFVGVQWALGYVSSVSGVGAAQVHELFRVQHDTNADAYTVVFSNNDDGIIGSPATKQVSYQIGSPFDTIVNLFEAYCNGFAFHGLTNSTPPVAGTFWELTGFDTVLVGGQNISGQFAVNNHTLTSKSISETFDDISGDKTLNGVSVGRGIIFDDFITVPVNTGAVAGHEDVVYTTPVNVRFPNNRAYRVRLTNAGIKSTSSQQPVLKLHTFNAGGILLVNAGIQPVTFTGVRTPLQTTEFVFIHNTGGVASKPLALTLTPSLAVAVTLDAGLAELAWKFTVEDIGSSTVINGVSL